MIKKNIKEINGKGACHSTRANVRRNIRPNVRHYTALEILILRHRINEIENTRAEFCHRKEEYENNLIRFAENSPIRIGMVRQIALLTGDIRTCDDLLNEINDIVIAYGEQTDDDEEGGGIKKEKGLKSSKWIDHVKAHSKEHNISYKQALKSAKETYKK